LAKSRFRLIRFFDELKRRKVVQSATGYAVVAWILLQIGEVTFEPLGIPGWVMTWLIVLAVAGFPVVLAISWFFDLTLKGFRKDSDNRADLITDGDTADREPLETPVLASVAVLPFEDMSPGHDQAYLCDGIAEEILNRLAKIDKLRVASRTSSFRFRGLPVSVNEIGKDLNVATVLEGSVRKDENQLRITTQLVSARDGFRVWSSSYDRELQHIFEIQSEIANHVADALEVTLGARPGEERHPTVNVKAYEYYLKGRQFFRRWGTRNMAFAIQMFAKAVEIDPGYARAWAALADGHSITCIYWTVSADNLAAAERASSKALALRPDLAEAHVSRGLSHFAARQNTEAIAEFETALRPNPNLFDAYYFYGRVRFQRGELQQAAELFEKAEQINEDDFQSPILLRQIYHSQGRLNDARQAARRGIERALGQLELHPDDTRALNLGLGALAELGEREKAIEFAARSLSIDGENPDTLYNVACGYALIGEPQRALDCLERASLRGMAIAAWAENDSDLESLRNLPRFLELMKSLREQAQADGQ
jgi:TolB-like protein/Flp pilus assembly protein TadD